jgi:uncharacterized damage-inducible protein DinB
MTCAGVVKHVILCGFNYILWIQKVTNLPQSLLPEGLREIDPAGHLEHLRLLAPFAEEGLSTLVDGQLEDQGYKSSWEREYTIEQMLEHAIIHLWRHRGQLERTDEHYLS